MGYSGTNQFWFAIQAPDKRNYGMELNNQVNEQPQNTQRTPASDFKVYNMTSSARARWIRRRPTAARTRR